MIAQFQGLSSWQRALIYSAAGAKLEVIFTGIRDLKNFRFQGFTQLWTLPLYAAGGLGLENLHDKMRNTPLPLRIAVYASLIFTIEYAGGWTAEKITGKCPWEYQGRYHLHGKINLPHFPAWAAVGLIAERIYHYSKSLKWHTSRA